MRARVEEVRASQSRHDQARRLEFQNIIDLLQADHTAHQQQTEMLSQQVKTQSHLSNSILTLAQEARRGISDVRRLVVLVFLAVMNIKSLAMSIQRSLDPTRELPAIIQDALGGYIYLQPPLLEYIQWKVRAICSCLPELTEQNIDPIQFTRRPLRWSERSWIGSEASFHS